MGLRSNPWENRLFWILHLIALFVFMPALFLTIPLHMIYGAVKKKG